MTRTPLSLWLALLVATGTGLPEAGAQVPAADRSVPSRDGIALKLKPEGGGVRVTIALAQMTTRPTFQGVRLYTYYIPFAKEPTRVGWVVADPGKQYSPPLETVVLHDRPYRYTNATVDRQENGAMSVERIEETQDRCRLRGVYSYLGRVFVIDEVLAFDQPVLLPSPPARAMPARTSAPK